MLKTLLVTFYVATLMLGSVRAAAQAPSPAGPPAADSHDVSSLAKTSQNPVGGLVSLPFQFNFNNGGGLRDQTFLNVNFQPVFPIQLNQDWTLIARTIVPLDSFPGTGTSRFSGVGDIQEQLYFTPARPGSIIWGIGPAFSMPTATVESARTGTWAAGGGLVILKMAGPFVLASVFNQFSPMSDDNGPPRTNLFVWQWAVNYNFGKGWALSAAPLITANWDAEAGDRWTVPFGGGISRTFVFNQQPMSLGVQYYHNVKRPETAPSNQVRFSWSLIFPSRPKGH